MIRYAITPGSNGAFLKRNRESDFSGLPAPGAFNDAASLQGNGLLPFPPSTSLLDQVHLLVQNGVDYIQLRERHLPAGELAALARQILEILNQAPPVNGRPTRLLINTRADVAAAIAAHGVHLPATTGGLSPLQVHRLYRSIGLPPPFVSKACHTLPEIRMALPQQPDLILFSPIFGKSINGIPVIPAIGLEALSAACVLAHPIPVLALGGVTAENTPACLHAGAAGVAGIRFFQTGHAPSQTA